MQLWLMPMENLVTSLDAQFWNKNVVAERFYAFIPCLYTQSNVTRASDMRHLKQGRMTQIVITLSWTGMWWVPYLKSWSVNIFTKFQLENQSTLSAIG